MCFEVRGESMTDNSFESLPPKTRLLAREIQRHHWQSKLHTHKYKRFIIVHRTDGILIKQITNHDLANNTITAHSLNPDYEDLIVNLDDVVQLFNVVKRQLDE